MIIAIDGPAASGKGTIAKRVAAHYGLPHLDTGLLYRGVGMIMVDRGFPLDNVEIAEAIAEALDPADLASDRLRLREAGEAASVVAAHGPVRAALFKMQRDFATKPSGAVMDGRDIGTVIVPEANAKLFVTASPEERARRRFRELVGRGEMAETAESLAAVLSDIRARDARDCGRKDAPLRVADNAVVIDTTNLDVEAAVAAAIAVVEASR